MALIQTNKIVVKCDNKWCDFEWEGTEKEFLDAMLYDGSLNHWPMKNLHKTYLALKNKECPHCKLREERIKNPPKEVFKRGGVIPTYPDQHRRRIY